MGSLIRFSARAALGLSLSLVCGLASAQQIDVCVNFAGSGMNAADQAAMIAKVQAYFTAAGLGPGDLQRVIVHNAVPAPPNCDMTAGFINNAVQRWHGSSNKRAHTCTVNQAHFLTKFPGAANKARRCQAMAETLAHEVGHLLCATHDCHGAGRKRVRGMAAPVACSGAAPTLMTTGLCVPSANRGIAAGGAGARAFSPLSILQIRLGIIKFALSPFNWDLSANFDVGVLRVIEGKSNTEFIPFGGETLVAEDPLVTFNYQILAGDQNMFQFGWLNEEDQFIEPLPVTENPDQLLEARSGTLLNFALLGLPGSGVDGQVFRQSRFANVALTGFSSPNTDAATPGVTGSYFSQADILFDVFGNQFRVLISSDDWGDQNGFDLPSTNPIPALGLWGVLALVAALLGVSVVILGRRA